MEDVKSELPFTHVPQAKRGSRHWTDSVRELRDTFIVKLFRGLFVLVFHRLLTMPMLRKCVACLDKEPCSACVNRKGITSDRTESVCMLACTILILICPITRNAVVVNMKTVAHRLTIFLQNFRRTVNSTIGFIVRLLTEWPPAQISSQKLSIV